MPHLHLSLQSGNDMILKRMLRRHQTKDAIAFCEKIQKVRPESVFGADLIAGFPTESDSMHKSSKKHITDCNLTYLHIFPFSAKQGTPAARMPQVEKKVIQKRSKELREVGGQRLNIFLINEVGKEKKVLVEKPGFGRTDIDESLWANIHKKRQRIKRGSGERMRKKGEKGAPTPAQMKRAKSEEMLEYIEKVLKKDKKLKNLMIPKKGKAGVTKFQKRAGSTKQLDSPYRMMMKNSWDEVTEASEYQGKKVELNNPTRGDVKKYKVYVKNDKGNVVKVEFGDPNMEIKRDDPARRKSFRARHNCDNPGPKYKARYWSCKFWSAKSVTDLMKG